MATDVDAVYLDFGHADSREPIEQRRRRASSPASTLPAGSMGPKVEAAVDFVRADRQARRDRHARRDRRLVAGTQGTQIVAGRLTWRAVRSTRPRGQTARRARAARRWRVAAGDRHPHRAHLDDRSALRHGCDGRSAPGRAVPSAVLAGLLALRLGHQRRAASAMRPSAASRPRWAPIYILLAVGALIGTWNMAGTIPTVVYYGIGILQPSVFYLCDGGHLRRSSGWSIGSSWTTAATLGVALRRAGAAARRIPAITAGAVISGAYFGDKMTPLSETTVLVPSMVGGVTVQQHVGAMIWTSGPAIVIAAHAVRGPRPPGRRRGHRRSIRRRPRRRSRGEFNISLLNLLPMVLLIVFSVRRAPPFLSIFGCALFAGRAGLVHPAAAGHGLRRRAGRRCVTNIKALYVGDGQRLRVQHRRRADRRRCSRAAAWRRC